MTTRRKAGTHKIRKVIIYLLTLLPPPCEGGRGMFRPQDIDENAFISQSNVVGVYGEGSTS